jgi:hypothetical protein
MERLLEKLLRLLTQSAGAQRSVLMLVDQTTQSLNVEAEVSLDVV